MTALEDIAAERRRQINDENWSVAHDDHHHRGELARAAAAYAYNSTLFPDEAEKHRRTIRRGSTPGMFSVIAWLWPWSGTWFKPKNQRRALVRAGALIVAKIERLDRTLRTNGPNYRGSGQRL